MLHAQLNAGIDKDSVLNKESLYPTFHNHFPEATDPSASAISTVGPNPNCHTTLESMATANGTNGVNGTHKSGHVGVEEFLKQSYDYLICGGGTAGLTIAARLTENPDITVGVIEAGKNRLGDPLVDTPALFVAMLGNKEYDWAWETVPQVRKVVACSL